MLGHPAGEFTLDQKCFEEIVRNYAEDGIDVPADYFHSAERDSPAKDRGEFVPSGWVKGLKIENGNLMGLVDWTEKARQQILNRELRFLSPAIRFSSKHPRTGADRGAVLSSLALCVKPFLRQLPEARAMHEQDGAAIQMSEVTINAAELAELSDDEPEEMILMSDHAVLLADGIGQATAPLTVRLAETESSLADIRTLADVAEARAAALESRLKLLNDAALDARVEDAFLTYRDARKLGPNAKKSMRLILASDPELFEAEYPRPKNAPSFMLRKLSDDPGTSSTLAGVKTVPDFAHILSDVKAKNPGADYDRQFDLALAEQSRLMGVAA